jgi:hypothetical protein
MSVCGGLGPSGIEQPAEANSKTMLNAARKRTEENDE